MTDISDEVRKVADEYDVFPLYTLADRIDRELVELPRDRDGKPIHIGDTVYAHGFPDGNGGATCEVCSIELNEGRESRIELDAGGVVTYRTPSSLTHELPDSFERIAEELDNFADENYASGLLKQGIKDFADRIRKLAKKEDRQCQ